MVCYNKVLLNLYSKWCVAFVSEGKAELREAVGQDRQMAALGWRS